MSSYQHLSVIVSNLRPILFACLLVITSPVQADDSCTGATLMDLNSSLRGHAGGGEFLVELEVPSAGILSVDAAAQAPAAGDSEVVVSLACLPRPAAEPIVLQRSASHQVLAVGSGGPYVFRVTAQDRRRALRELKLKSAFVADAGAGGVPNRYGEDEDEIEIDGFAGPDARYGEDEDEIEIDGFAGPNTRYGEDEDEIEIDGFAGPDARYGEDEDEIEIDGFAGPDARYGEDEDEIEIDGFAAAGHGRSLVSQLDRLCRRGEVDDHGDSFTCATFLMPGRAVSGELGNGWGDDVDTFHFVLGGSPGADLRTVVIETAGGIDTAGGLYDQAGQRLDVNDDGGRGDNFRIVRSLRPGAYYVRVAGRHAAEGPYTLRVGTLN